MFYLPEHYVIRLEPFQDPLYGGQVNILYIYVPFSHGSTVYPIINDPVALL